MRTTTHAIDVDRLKELLRIPGTSRKEEQVADYVVSCLHKIGVPSNAIELDTAHKAFDGSCGNVIVHLAGNKPGNTILFSAHLDTVPVCIGSEPILDGDSIVSANPLTGLGADDRAGVCVLLETIEAVVSEGIPHPPVTFLFSVAEEVGMLGVRHVDFEKLHSPVIGFNFDGGRANKITTGANGKEIVDIRITGTEAHAGVAPASGVSAITIAGLGIARASQSGLLGQCNLFASCATCNLGTIQGGTATNVVPGSVDITGEIRSTDKAVRDAVFAGLEGAFSTAAQSLTPDNRHSQVKLSRHLAYEAYQLTNDSAVIHKAAHAIAMAGMVPTLEATQGGVDANWLVKRGIPTASLGCGHENFHTVNERLNLIEFTAACKIALELLTSPLPNE